MLPMTLDPSQLPDDIATLKAMVIAGGREIEALKLTIAKMRRDKFGASSERGAKLLDQLELQLAELEERASQDMASAAIKAPPMTEARRKPARRPLPEHLPRERVVHSAPSTCPSCGGTLRKLGEDITETLEAVPARRSNSKVEGAGGSIRIEKPLAAAQSIAGSIICAPSSSSPPAARCCGPASKRSECAG
jgi:hypothetical protein